MLAADTLPYRGEEYICAGLTLSDLPKNVEIKSTNWVTGNDPTKTSYCSPWVLSTIKHDSVSAPQGYVTDEFAETILRQAVEYLADDIGLDIEFAT